jgi:VCBS repeat protein/FG-GAP repeat protein
MKFLPVTSLFMLTALAADVSAQASLMSATPLWKAESNQAFAGFGSAVASAGDVNGDGYADVLVGAYSFDGAEQNQGSAALFLGSPDGPSKTPDWMAVGEQGSSNFGETVASAGDVNGDGFDDVLVGAHLARKAYLYLGSASGLAKDAAWIASSSDYEFGWSVASAGDVNGDGFDDVLVSALGFTGHHPYEGRVYGYLGSPTGLGAGADWIVDGNQSYSWFGGWVTGAGDVNGDGFDDVVIGAARWSNGEHEEGRAFAYLGSPAGLETSASWTVEGDQAGALFASWVGAAGDVNGDGFDDVILGSNTGGSQSEGSAEVFHGSAAGLETSAAWSVRSHQAVALGGAVSSGDLDGDGFDDVLVGFYSYDHGQQNEGVVFAYYGSALGLSTRVGWSAEGNQRNSMFGYALAGAGDVNGDGFDDVLVGAYDFDAGQRGEGRAFAYLGATRRRVH